MSLTDDPTDRVLALLPDAKQFNHSPERWKATCPAHDDSTPSLQITRGNDGACLVVCHGKCSTESVVAALGLTMADLFPKEDKPRQKKVITPFKLVAEYPYYDEDGTPLYTVERRERFVERDGERKKEKEFPARKPDGSYGIADIKRVPYHLIELNLADEERVTFIPEGERDVHTLEAHGLVATCNPGGAGKWRPEFQQYFVGRKVVVLPDNDDPGRKHAVQVAENLAPAVPWVRVVQLPRLGPKEDVTDWFDKHGGSISELKQLVNAAPNWGESAEQEAELALPDYTGDPLRERWVPKPITEWSAELAEVDWLWYGYVARRYTTLLTGEPKAGKSTLLSNLFAAMAHSREFLGLGVMNCKALLVTEEDAGHWVRRREMLRLTDRLHMVSVPFVDSIDPGIWREFVEYVALRMAVDQFDFVVIDTLHNLWSVVDENDAPKVKGAMEPLRRIKQAGAGLVLIAHSNKAGTSTRGSSVIQAETDINLTFRFLHGQPETDTRRVITYKGRWDVAAKDHAIDFDPQRGYWHLGTVAQAHAEERRATLVALLPKEGEGLTRDEIWDEWPEGGRAERPTKQGLMFELRQLASRGDIHELVKKPPRYRLNNSNPEYLRQQRSIIGNGHQETTEVEYDESGDIPF